MELSTFLLALTAFASGAVLAWLLVRARAKSPGARLVAAETALEAERVRRQAVEEELGRVRAEKEGVAQELVAARERFQYAEKTIEEQKVFLETSRQELKVSFEALAAEALRGNREEFLKLADRDLEERKKGIETLLGPMRQTLESLEKRTGEVEKAREGAYEGLREQLKTLLSATATLQEKTTSLTSALKGSRVQGRWGEIALRNVVELAGMSQHVDFVEQEAVPDGKRPDMVVRLPGERFIAVDSKVSFNAYVEATEATNDDVREEALDRHVAALRSHIRTLASRDYARIIEGDVDLVVLFLPGDPFLAAAFARDPDIQLDALRAKVLVATPTTLVALLRTVAIYWQQKSLAENAERIAAVARDLYERAAVFGEHLAKVGKGLESAVDAYNRASGSFARRFLPMGRRLEELKVTEQSARQLDTPATVEVAPREIPGRAAGEDAAGEDAAGEAEAGRPL